MLPLCHELPLNVPRWTEYGIEVKAPPIEATAAAASMAAKRLERRGGTAYPTMPAARPCNRYR